MSLTSVVVCLLTVSVAAPATAQPGVAAADSAAEWHRPNCRVVDSNGGLSFTTDEGDTITPTTSPIPPRTYSHVAVLPHPNTLIATSDNAIWRSTDAGCDWTMIGKDPAAFQAEIAPGLDDTAYVYGVNRQPIYVVDGDQVTKRMGPVTWEGVIGLTADRDTPHTLRAVSDDGQIYVSSDDAKSWHRVGHPPRHLQWGAYAAAIDPTNPDHVVIGGSWSSFVTFDGGQDWQRIHGFTDGKHSNVFTVAISTVDPSVVWAEAIDLTESGVGSRKIYRSLDGGRTFTPLIGGAQIRLANGATLYPSPVNADVVYFTYGSWYHGFGTNLYRLTAALYGAQQERLTYTHSSFDGIDSIAFNPADPSVMYLGLEEVGCVDFC